MMLIVHTIIYLVTFIISYYFAINGTYQFLNLIINGWSIFGLTSVGHEIYHLHNNSFLTNLMGFICLDLWSVSRENWIERHNKWHHYNVWEDGEDEHMIMGSELRNLIHTTTTLVKTYKILEFSLRNLFLIIFRIIFFGLINPYAIFVVYSVVTFCVTYMTFITHSAVVIDDSDDYIMRQLHRSVDIFPNSWFTSLISGAFHMHTAHHLKPQVTRDNLYKINCEYTVKYPDDYRVINTWKELYNLFKYRGVVFSSMEEWNSCIKS